jgi:hypothetical protein
LSSCLGVGMGLGLGLGLGLTLGVGVAATRTRFQALVAPREYSHLHLWHVSSLRQYAESGRGGVSVAMRKSPLVAR